MAKVKKSKKKNKTMSIKKRSNDVPEDKRFWCNDGRIFKNLNELKAALKKMDKNTFIHHVNTEKNDFSNWVRDVIGKKKLASDLMKCKTRSCTMDAIKKVV